MLVKEIMIADVLTANEKTPVAQIAELVSKNRIHGVPVIDKDRRVVGIITETDFFKKDSSGTVYIPQLIEFAKNKKCLDPNCECEILKAANLVLAKDIMTKNCVNVHPETTAEELIILIKKHNFNTFPVVDENDVLVGIVTVYDMIKMI